MESPEGKRAWVFDTTTGTELWAAYHIIGRINGCGRPAAGAHEVHLVDGSIGSGVGASCFALHPALAVTWMGDHFVQLEQVSGRLFLQTFAA